MATFPANLGANDIGENGASGYVKFKILDTSPENTDQGNDQGDGSDAEANKENLEKQEEDSKNEQEAEEEGGFLGFLNDVGQGIRDLSGAINEVGDAFNQVLDAFNGNEDGVRPIRNGAPTLTIPGGDVVMYLPVGFQMNEGVQYDAFDLGITGAAAARGAGIVESAIAAGGFSDMDITGQVDAIKQGLAGNQETAAKVASTQMAKMARVASRLGGGVGAGIELHNGVALNPHTRALFRRVNVREFAFNFTMVPMNAADAGAITEIIQTFRKELYPTLTDGIVYEHPNKFMIEVGNGLGWKAPEIKDCVLRNVAVTYNPNVNAYHVDGNPVETQLSLNFMETRTLDKGDV